MTDFYRTHSRLNRHAEKRKEFRQTACQRLLRDMRLAALGLLTLSGTAAAADAQEELTVLTGIDTSSSTLYEILSKQAGENWKDNDEHTFAGITLAEGQSVLRTGGMKLGLDTGSAGAISSQHLTALQPPHISPRTATGAQISFWGAAP